MSRKSDSMTKPPERDPATVCDPDARLALETGRNRPAGSLKGQDLAVSIGMNAYSRKGGRR